MELGGLAVGKRVAVGWTVCVAALRVGEALGGTVDVEALLHPAASMAASTAATIFKRVTVSNITTTFSDALVRMLKPSHAVAGGDAFASARRAL